MITEMLDKIADSLEAKGAIKEAAEIDVISNTIEAAELPIGTHPNVPERPWRVSVWFGGEGEASVSEDFKTHEEAKNFASKYLTKEYPDCQVRIFDLRQEARVAPGARTVAPVTKTRSRAPIMRPMLVK